MIELRGVWFRYPGGGWVLRGVDASFRRAEVTALVGPNGSGKTTLMKVASLIYRPAMGRVEVDGVDAWTSSDDVRLRLRRMIIYVHETPVMLRGTVRENIAYGLRLRGLGEADIEKRIEEVASALGLERILDKRASKLSAGQAQLVAIARALAVKPQMLLLDEPFAHLDQAKRRLLTELIERLPSSGTGVVIASHDVYLASRLATRTINLE
ncbi:MAG: ABC transporter ATP-binding protein [Thermoproteota archaeon]